tara:strand:+ start:831 stop:1013 length:183 start_codon:yes stop_codon:yes gene_type:complete
MSKNSKNNGKLKQDAILSQFRKDARSSEENCAVMQCMNRLPKVMKEAQVQMSFRFLATGK